MRRKSGTWNRQTVCSRAVPPSTRGRPRLTCRPRPKCLKAESSWHALTRRQCTVRVFVWHAVGRKLFAASTHPARFAMLNLGHLVLHRCCSALQPSAVLAACRQISSSAAALGRGDRKTKRGKRFAHSYGVYRRKKGAANNLLELLKKGVPRATMPPAAALPLPVAGRSLSLTPWALEN